MKIRVVNQVPREGKFKEFRTVIMNPEAAILKVTDKGDVMELLIEMRDEKGNKYRDEFSKVQQLSISTSELGN